MPGSRSAVMRPPALLRAGTGFWISLALSCLVCALAYGLTLWSLARFGLRT